MALEEINGPVVLEVPTDPRSLFLVRGLVERLTERLEFPRETVERMVLAVDEACTNVIRHAYGNRPNERIVITLLVSESRMEIQVRDFGAPVAPESLKPRGLSEVRPGGLGIHFMKSAMDEVEYETPAGGGMLLRMVKLRVKKEVLNK